VSRARCGSTDVNRGPSNVHFSTKVCRELLGDGIPEHTHFYPICSGIVFLRCSGTISCPRRAANVSRPELRPVTHCSYGEFTIISRTVISKNRFRRVKTLEHTFENA